jgi:hypothetical protein
MRRDLDRNRLDVPCGAAGVAAGFHAQAEILGSFDAERDTVGDRCPGVARGRAER